jgi:DNA damage-inducible protein 1
VLFSFVMILTVTTLTGQMFPVEVAEDLELENFKAICEAESGYPAEEMAILVILHLEVMT